jgi:diguanylate cyclase (GGDEF)-like protein
VTRMGGDEFLVLAPEITSMTQVEAVATHMLKAMRDPFRLGELTLTPTFSAGIALFPQDGASVSALIASSDRAMYAAKGLGKDRFAFASAAS